MSWTQGLVLGWLKLSKKIELDESHLDKDHKNLKHIEEEAADIEDTAKDMIQEDAEEQSKEASDTGSRDAWNRRTQLWKVMKTMDPNDPVYQDMKDEYDSLATAAEEYVRQPTLASKKVVWECVKLGGADDHLHRADPAKAECLQLIAQPCQSCGHPLSEHLPTGWLEPGFLYSVLPERFEEKANRTGCKLYLQEPAGRRSCGCSGFIGKDAPQDITDIKVMDPKDRQKKLDELLDQFSAEQDHDNKKQIEEQMRSLKAKVVWEYYKVGGLDKTAVLHHEEDGWHIYSEKGKHLGGPYSEEHAKKRLQEMEYWKSKKAYVR